MAEHKQYATSPGSRFPRGATVLPGGINFSVLSRGATHVELLLYADHDSLEPFQIIELDPLSNRTYVSWHVMVEGLKAGVHYTWRVHGSRFEERELDTDRELLDPWATAVTDTLWQRWENGSGHSRRSMRAMAVESHRPHQIGQADRPAKTEKSKYRAEDAIIYEMHIGGFTRHASSGVAPEKRGTFVGAIEKVPYLKELGITHVELLPVMAYDAQDVPSSVAKAGLRNYWGYSPHSFFCPHPGYCATPEKGTHIEEFKQLVAALHDAGIEVILDVVFNHTAEGGKDGPTINFKGFDNELFYHVDPENDDAYRDYTGCGNTLNANQPIVSAFLLDCLEFWAQDIGVDGFRFDLASVLCRGMDGAPLDYPPVVWSIELSPLLARKRIIAEAWDAVGLYQVGNFPGYRWSEWNGNYRDVVRSFVRGDRGMIAHIATRIGGSSDYYRHQDRHPFNSVNFVTCHDGFTLWDLVSYNHKHNLHNSEDNRDGHNDNLSWNCGTEGLTDDPRILALRKKQARNFLAILMTSQGVPMLLAGDEVLRTQWGNNNAWCQDNETNWFDWTLTEQNADMLRFTREMIALRRRHPNLRRRHFLNGELVAASGIPDITWHGADLDEPNWHDPIEQIIGFTLSAVEPEEPHLFVVMNMSDLQRDIPLPSLDGVTWSCAVDTARPAPNDITPPEAQQQWTRPHYPTQGRSVVVLEGEWR